MREMFFATVFATILGALAYSFVQDEPQSIQVDEVGHLINQIEAEEQSEAIVAQSLRNVTATMGQKD